MLRNELVAAPIYWHAGRHADARQRMARLLADQPTLTQRNMRRVQAGSATVLGLLTESLTAAGLPT